MSISTFLKKLGLIRYQPGIVVLSLDDIEVIDEALAIYQERLPTQKHGRFYEAAVTARQKVKSLEPGLFRKFFNQ